MGDVKIVEYNAFACFWCSVNVRIREATNVHTHLSCPVIVMSAFQ